MCDFVSGWVLRPVCKQGNNNVDADKNDICHNMYHLNYIIIRESACDKRLSIAVSLNPIALPPLCEDNTHTNDYEQYLNFITCTI
jgi:hypothetical protein